MRKQQKQKAEELVRQMEEAHDQLKKYIEQGSILSAMELLEECQNSGITLGTLIENTEGEAHPTVSLLEEYCELAYQIHEQLTEKKEMNTNKTYKLLRQKLIKVSNSLKNDVRIRIEVAFFPYKASMWDSLESVYLAAKEDSDCDAYCVPIPYYDMNSDRSFGQMHYEGGEYPDGIEITDWQEYDFEERKPDVIFIHNIYDNYNLVTSVHPRYYSGNLKRYTERLVYIPYYMTSGGMSEGQGFCPSYMNADYIVIQSPKIRKFFDARIPDKKFLPFGSPKADRVIRKCQNPPAPPKEWNLSDAQLEKMSEKKVYFYNTSIGGMLADTENFLKKMRYVFKCFEGRENACILWRPHPLLEATFRSMRSEYEQEFYKLKKYFVEKEIGILDTTADIEDAIALSDAYIGDAGTSVTALFGVAGKPVFILNNKIQDKPDEDGWKKEFDAGFNYFEQDRFVITQGNKLYVSKPYQYDYHYFCDLSKDMCWGEYSTVYEINGKWYVCPANAQNILVIGKEGVEKKIELQKRIKKGKAFKGACKYKQYLLLVPLEYPCIVRYDTVAEELQYFDNHTDVLWTEKSDGQLRAGAVWIYQDSIYIFSTVDNKVCRIYIDSGEMESIEIPIQSRCGCVAVYEYEGELWLMPYRGKVIVRWNFLTGETREYNSFPDNFICTNPVDGRECEERLFNLPAISGEYLYLIPNWSNMYLKLNINTGEFTTWKPPFEKKAEEMSAYLNGTFGWQESKKGKTSFKFYLSSDQRSYIYNINLETNKYEEIPICFDVDELRENEPGFCEYSETLRYACIENCFNTLEKFLMGETVGNQFSKEKQRVIYEEIIADCNGGCGERVHEFIKRI